MACTTHISPYSQCSESIRSLVEESLKRRGAFLEDPPHQDARILDLCIGDDVLVCSICLKLSATHA